MYFFLFVFLVIILPLTLVHFGATRDWRFRKLSAEQVKQKDAEGWRLLGYIFMLIGFGISIVPNTVVSALPFWARGIFFIIGIAMLYFSGRNK